MALVHLEHVTKRFGADRPPATDGLSFTVESGRILALIGPSGCGKTTTLRLIAGFGTRRGRRGRERPPLLPRLGEPLLPRPVLGPPRPFIAALVGSLPEWAPSAPGGARAARRHVPGDVVTAWRIQTFGST